MVPVAFGGMLFAVGSDTGSTVYFPEREKLYIFSSHRGLIRCLTPTRVNAIIYSQAFLDEHPFPVIVRLRPSYIGMCC